MLWKKESKKKDALYVDIMAIAGPPELEESFLIEELDVQNKILEKNDTVSLVKRQEGNTLFSAGDVMGAIRLYNESLCFAPEGSKHISLAYANRSASFFHLNMFEKCLKDIELAEKFDYPKELMPKLNQRKAECVKYFVNGENRKKLEVKLDFEADDKFSCMANVLRTERNVDGNYSTVAKEYIDIGKVVVVEKAFVNCLYNNQLALCSHCLKWNTNLMPCNKCTNAMFCSDECQVNIFHQAECGKNICHDYAAQENGLYTMIFKSVLLAINLFPSVNKLIQFVEKINTNRSKVFTTHITDTLSQYEAFLRLPFTLFTDKIDSIIGSLYLIYKNILEIPKVRKSFDTEKNRRFLMHLISHHHYVFQGHKTPDYWQICLMYQFFNYSCTPNVLKASKDGHDIYITIRPIHKGTSLQLTHVELLKPKLERQRIIWNKKKTICMCMRCIESGELTVSPVQQHQLRSDSNFQYILSHYYTKIDDIHLHVMKVKCMSFLKKFKKITWCPEIGMVLEYFVKVLVAIYARSDLAF